jgi:uncharacterized membrane protein
MGVVRAVHRVPLDPAAAMELWTDVSRWPTFVEGFSHAERLDEAWPREGSKLVWRSIPEGRGLVTERVLELRPGERIVTQVLEDALSGAQSISFTAEEGEGTAARIELDYELTGFGALRGVADLLFIRRALRAAQERTLRRFATEATEHAELST